ncbi:DUF1643 domain-containing protein [Microbacterium sp.]|uniref:DUF1643 domain-containing protein n=1 Tax=Microbacterium sp. TaxID=51671 RepID=UPI003564DBCE
MPHSYPQGQAPQYWRPSPPSPDHRFTLGSSADPATLAGSNPLVVIGMNPSHATDQVSDSTVNRVVEASVELHHTSWWMLNLYPERSSEPANLHAFDPALSAENCREIADFLRAAQVNQVLGAWGDLNHPTLRQAKKDVLAMLHSISVRVYYYDTLTGRGNPRHPNPRGRHWDVSGPMKYLV